MGPGLSAFREKREKNAGLKERRVLSLSYGKIVVKSADKLHGLVPESFETYQIVNPGDIIIRSTDLQNDWNSMRVGFVRDRGIITSAYLCFTVRDSLLPEYGYFQLHAFDLMKIFYGMGSGLRQNLDFADFKRMPVVTPSREEQATIVRFLNHANSRFEQAIAAKKRLIGLLNEQKRVIIHRAVTRGLDAGVKRRPTGIPHLGEIPKHWEVRKMKYLVSMRGGMTPSKATPGFWDGRIPWVSPKDMKRPVIHDSQDHITQAALDRTSIRLIEPPAVLIVVRGMILARTFPVAITAVPVTVNQDMKALIPKNELTHQFLAYLLRGIETDLLSLVEESGHGTRCFRTDSWKNFAIGFPPKVEQLQIAAHLDTVLAGLEKTTSRIQREIDLIREYRTRLITDVVTGHLDVRRAAQNISGDRNEPASVEELDEALVSDCDEN